MSAGNIEILSIYPLGAVHRIKFNPLIQQNPDGLKFCNFGEGNENTVGVLVNGLHIDLDKEARVARLIEERAKYAIIMLFIPDIDSKLIPSLKKWSKFVDIFLMPTPEMKKVVELFTERPVEVLLDPIDFGFMDSFRKADNHDGPMKIGWFGFPDSYQKSMPVHANTLFKMHANKEIEYHIVTQHNHPDDAQKCILHQYVPETFPSLLQTFDACVLSHVPIDFDINTYCKSENKAVLAINRGVPVIASRTPAYERLLTKCGLGEYLFTSNRQIVDCINRLRPRDEQKRYLELSQELVLKNYSAQKMVQDWLEIYQRARSAKF